MTGFWTNNWRLPPDGKKGFVCSIYDDDNIAKLMPEDVAPGKTIIINGIERTIIKAILNVHACDPDIGIVHSMGVWVNR